MICFVQSGAARMFATMEPNMMISCGSKHIHMFGAIYRIHRPTPYRSHQAPTTTPMKMTACHPGAASDVCVPALPGCGWPLLAATTAKLLEPMPSNRRATTKMPGKWKTKGIPKKQKSKRGANSWEGDTFAGRSEFTSSQQNRSKSSEY